MICVLITVLKVLSKQLGIGIPSLWNEVHHNQGDNIEEEEEEKCQWFEIQYKNKYINAYFLFEPIAQWKFVVDCY